MKKFILICLFLCGLQASAVAGTAGDPFDPYVADYTVSKSVCPLQDPSGCNEITGISISYLGSPAQLFLIEEGASGKVSYPLNDMSHVDRDSIERAGTSYGPNGLAMWEHFTQTRDLIESDGRSIGVFGGDIVYTHDYRHYGKGMKSISTRKQFILLRK